MNNKMVKFTLKKEGAIFSEKQKRDVKMHVEYEDNWKNFRDLETIFFMDITENYLVVRVQENGDTWHSNFSKILNEKAMLKNLCVEPTSGNHLFNVEEQDLDEEEWFNNFRFLENHPLYLSKTKNKYGYEYRFNDGYIHILNMEYAKNGGNIVHYGLFGTSYDEEEYNKLIDEAKKVGKGLNPL